MRKGLMICLAGAMAFGALASVPAQAQDEGMHRAMMHRDMRHEMRRREMHRMMRHRMMND